MLPTRRRPTLLQIQRVLAIPGKRYDRVQIHFLSHAELDALLGAPELETWSGRRDHALLMVAVQTGLRLSELTGLKRQDVMVDTGAHLRCTGKGRKERCTPLTKQTRAVLKNWLNELESKKRRRCFPMLAVAFSAVTACDTFSRSILALLPGVVLRCLGRK